MAKRGTTKMYQIVPWCSRTDALLRGVIVGTLGMHIPLVPAQFPLQGHFGGAVGGYCSLPLVVEQDG